MSRRFDPSLRGGLDRTTKTQQRMAQRIMHLQAELAQITAVLQPRVCVVPECGRLFVARRNAKYCSAACRNLATTRMTRSRTRRVPMDALIW
jgi:hypothetical protein